MSHVDVAIVGAGTAGLAATHAALRHTRSVALIEAGPGGTTCARVGCMPSKLLIAAADAAHDARRSDRFGIRTDVHVDDRAVLARVRSERDRFTGFVLQGMQRLPDGVLRHGAARFVDDHTLRIGEQTLTAERIVLAVGSRPRVLPFLADLGDRLVVSEDVFSWERLPDSVALFGPGVIGLELGQALQRLGVRVTFFGVDGLLGPITDPELRRRAHAVFGAELDLHTDARVENVERSEDGIVVRHRVGDELVAAHFDLALAATGRLANLDRLDLDRTSLPRTATGGLPVDPTTLRVGDSHVFVAGDATGERPLLHEAADEGRIAGANAGRFPDVRSGARRSPLAIVFSDPQIAMVGARWADLREADVVVGRVSFDDQGRSRVMAVNRGALHVYVDAHTGVLRGAEHIGPRAEHLAHLLAWAHQQRLTVEQMLAMPYYHPVIEEGVRTALRDARRQLNSPSSTKEPS